MLNRSRSSCTLTLFLIAYRQKLLEEGKSESEIADKLKQSRRRNTKVYRNKKLMASEDLDWGADLERQSFEFKMRGAPEDQPGEMVTIERYFLLRYKIKLRFPKMPIVHLLDGKEEGWFPIEFLFQAWGKVRDTDHNPDVLKFNDHFASTDRIEHLKDVKMLVDEVKQQSGPELSMLLQQLHLTSSLRPEELTATVLQQPVVTFQGGNDKIPTDGSWNLAGAKFPKPAFLSSFAILDFARNDDRSVAFETMFRTMESHGMEMPRNVDVNQAIRNLIVRVDDPNSETVSTYLLI